MLLSLQNSKNQNLMPPAGGGPGVSVCQSIVEGATPHQHNHPCLQHYYIKKFVFCFHTVSTQNISSIFRLCSNNIMIMIIIIIIIMKCGGRRILQLLLFFSASCCFGSHTVRSADHHCCLEGAAVVGVHLEAQCAFATVVVGGGGG